MRHNKKFNHLSRTSAHRKSMLSNMASSLIENKRITTTLAKAKALRIYVEPLITKAKNDTTHSRRTVFSHLQNKNAVSELFREVAVKVGERPGGYTRILKTENRLGDNAQLCIIELVDYNEAMLATKDEAEKPKRRRSRRGGSGKKAQTPSSEIDKQVKQKPEKETLPDKEVKPDEKAVDEPVAEESKSVESIEADVPEEDKPAKDPKVKADDDEKKPEEQKPATPGSEADTENKEE